MRGAHRILATRFVPYPPGIVMDLIAAEAAHDCSAPFFDCGGGMRFTERGEPALGMMLAGTDPKGWGRSSWASIEVGYADRGKT